MFLVDSHCHFDLLDKTAENGDIHTVIKRAQHDGVCYFLNVCVSIAAFPNLLEVADQYPFMSVSVGLHPNAQDEEVDTETLIKLAQHPKVVAIGETGLDCFRSTGEITWQHERFRRHIQAAKQLQKPLIIHTRNAKEDTLRIMREEGADQVGGVMHCFSEDWSIAQQAMELGFYISFSGIVTFKNAKVIQEVARQIPLNRMLIETDSPYLAPNPKRGKANEPAYVRYTAEYLASLRNIELEEFAEQTTQNFFSLFKGAVRPHV
jgi:TatD DNase family protein